MPGGNDGRDRTDSELDHELVKAMGASNSADGQPIARAGKPRNASR
jgi:hypothetical protein